MDERPVFATLLEDLSNAQGRDWPKSYALAAEMRRCFPDERSGYQIGASSARALGKYEEAAALLTESASRFANQPWVTAERAWTALARRDFREAFALAAELREIIPGSPAGYQIGASGARALGKYDEAAALLAECASRFPGETWVASERALVAQARGDHGEALAFAAELRRDFPDKGAGYQIGASSARALGRYDEAARILADCAPRFPKEPWVTAERARTAQARGDFGEAFTLAAQLRRTAPADAAGYQVGAASARALERYDDAAALLADSASRFPGETWVTAERAWTAQARGDFGEALIFAAELRRDLPDKGAGYQIGASSARALGRYDEAAALLAESASRFPRESWVTAELAWTAQARGDFRKALTLALELRGLLPDSPAPFQIEAGSLRASNRLGEAEALLTEALRRFPDHGWFADELNKIKSRRLNHERALLLTEALSRRARELSLATLSVPPRDRVFVVLGMHRAGTSLCARIINGLGVELGGPLLPANYANQDGYQEHRAIVACHDALLKEIGADWSFSQLAWPGEMRLEGARITAIVDRLKSIVADELEKSDGVWAFKDPRTVHFIPLWKKIFDEMQVQPVWLLSVRDPRTVAASLHKRDAFPLALGELLWVEHYLDALRHLGSQIACVIHYEDWFSGDAVQLDRLAKIIGATSRAAIERSRGFINSDYRHHRVEKAYALEAASKVHGWLLDKSANGERLEEQAEALWRYMKSLGEA